MTDAETIHRFAEANRLVERYLLGELTGADLEDFEQHMFECQICFQDVQTGQWFKQGIVATNAEDVPRKSLWQRIKEFWAKHVSREGQC